MSEENPQKDTAQNTSSAEANESPQHPSPFQTTSSPFMNGHPSLGIASNGGETSTSNIFQRQTVSETPQCGSESNPISSNSIMGGKNGCRHSVRSSSSPCYGYPQETSSGLQSRFSMQLLRKRICQRSIQSTEDLVSSINGEEGDERDTVFKATVDVYSEMLRNAENFSLRQYLPIEFISLFKLKAKDKNQRKYILHLLEVLMDKVKKESNGTALVECYCAALNWIELDTFEKGINPLFNHVDSLIERVDRSKNHIGEATARMVCPFLMAAHSIFLILRELGVKEWDPNDEDALLTIVHKRIKKLTNYNCLEIKSHAEITMQALVHLKTVEGKSNGKQFLRKGLMAVRALFLLYNGAQGLMLGGRLGLEEIITAAKFAREALQSHSNEQVWYNEIAALAAKGKEVANENCTFEAFLEKLNEIPVWNEEFPTKERRYLLFGIILQLQALVMDLKDSEKQSQVIMKLIDIAKEIENYASTFEVVDVLKLLLQTLADLKKRVTVSASEIDKIVEKLCSSTKSEIKNEALAAKELFSHLTKANSTEQMFFHHLMSRLYTLEEEPRYDLFSFHSYEKWTEELRNYKIFKTIHGVNGELEPQRDITTVEFSLKIRDSTGKKVIGSLSYDEFPNKIKNMSKILVVGHPGSGKTTLAQKLAYDWIARALFWGLSFYEEKDSICFIEEQLGLSNTLVILDGVNEHPEGPLLRKTRSGSHKLLVISNSYRAVHPDEYDLIVELEGLSEEQLERYLCSIENPLISDCIRKCKLTMELAKRPLFLVILHQILERDERQIESRAKVALFEEFINNVWQRKERRDGDQRLPYCDDCFNDLGDVALEFVRRGVVDTISCANLSQFDRAAILDKAKRSFMKVLIDRGIVIEDVEGHRSFQHEEIRDYFAARRLMPELLDNENGDSSSKTFIRNEKFNRHFEGTIELMGGFDKESKLKTKSIEILLKTLDEGDCDLLGMYPLKLKLAATQQWLLTHRGRNNAENGRLNPTVTEVLRIFKALLKHCVSESYKENTNGELLMIEMNKLLKRFPLVVRNVDGLWNVVMAKFHWKCSSSLIVALANIVNALDNDIDRSEVSELLRYKIENFSSSNADIDAMARFLGILGRHSESMIPFILESLKSFLKQKRTDLCREVFVDLIGHRFQTILGFQDEFIRCLHENTNYSLRKRAEEIVKEHSNDIRFKKHISCLMKRLLDIWSGERSDKFKQTAFIQSTFELMGAGCKAIDNPEALLSWLFLSIKKMNNDQKEVAGEAIASILEAHRNWIDDKFRELLFGNLLSRTYLIWKAILKREWAHSHIAALLEKEESYNFGTEDPNCLYTHGFVLRILVHFKDVPSFVEQPLEWIKKGCNHEESELKKLALKAIQNVVECQTLDPNALLECLRSVLLEQEETSTKHICSVHYEALKTAIAFTKHVLQSHETLLPELKSRLSSEDKVISDAAGICIKNIVVVDSCRKDDIFEILRVLIQGNDVHGKRGALKCIEEIINEKSEYAPEVDEMLTVGAKDENNDVSSAAISALRTVAAKSNFCSEDWIPIFVEACKREDNASTFTSIAALTHCVKNTGNHIESLNEALEVAIPCRNSNEWTSFLNGLQMILEGRSSDGAVSARLCKSIKKLFLEQRHEHEEVYNLRIAFIDEMPLERLIGWYNIISDEQSGLLVQQIAKKLFEFPVSALKFSTALSNILGNYKNKRNLGNKIIQFRPKLNI